MTASRLSVVYNDRESEARTPAQPLVVIPGFARDPYSAMPAMPAVAAAEADLTRIAPGRPQAAGEAIWITGQVLDEDRRPVRHAILEVWNANTHGRYSHALDGGNAAPLDPHFYGFGRVVTDDDGRYSLRTIKPGAYIARADIGWWRPPHVHFSLLGGGVRLVTQMYFPAEPLNEKDYIHMIIPEAERPRVIARAEAESDFRFDIVVRGRFQTPLEV
jgi:protocatechuate 3,4-dioxygenase beta subunit